MMVYRMIWSDGEIQEYPADQWLLRELQNLRKEIELATKGAYTAHIELVEVNP